MHVLMLDTLYKYIYYVYHSLYFSPLQGEQSMTFDEETAIKVCHQANYHRHALALARKYQRHDWLVNQCIHVYILCVFPSISVFHTEGGVPWDFQP